MDNIVLKIVKYLPWAAFQQTMNVFIFSEWRRIMPDRYAIPLTVFFFVILHFPNRFLMISAAIIETAFLALYAGPGSLIWMTLIHSALAVSMKRWLPDSLTKGMRVLWFYEEE
jgi:hypothetical protein